jgi:hypothetical protein
MRCELRTDGEGYFEPANPLSGRSSTAKAPTHTSTNNGDNSLFSVQVLS